MPINDEEFSQLARYIKSHFGIHLKQEKKALLVGRLHQVLQKLHMKSFDEYYQYLLKDNTGEAARVLINQVSTNHTFFMREVSHFHFLQEKVLPFLSKRIHNRDFRIWCAGCSTGEEAYTLAMILEDYFGNQYPAWDKQLLATDISTKVLEKAMRGKYDKEAIEKLQETWIKKYFRRTMNDYEVHSKIKKDIIFGQFNLMENYYPFKKKFHIIFCRNVMIYFDNETKDRILRHFYEILEPGGFLFIGHSESINRNLLGFQYVIPSVYQKT